MLHISDIRLWIALGCSSEERQLPRCISLDIYIHFKDDYLAAKSDNLEDAICYKTIVEGVKAFCTTREFNLIEFVAGEVHREVLRLIKDPADKVIVKASKLLPPVSDIHGCVSFTYSG